MLFVTTFTNLFGAENSIVGVITVIGVLTYRLSNLGFNVKQSALAILGVYGIYIIFPYLASISNPFLGAIINFVALMVIVILTCYDIRLSNQSIFILGYFLLYGYKVTSIDSLISRGIALIVGGLLVSSIFYIKSRKTIYEATIRDVIKSVKINNERTKWQIKLVLLISTAVLIGELVHIPRTMWIAFACMSVLQPDKEMINFRYIKRSIFIIVGCLVVGIIYTIVPDEIKSFIGLAGGVLSGFCMSYQGLVVFNCFGALSSAIVILGVWPAIILRIINNVFGCFYAKAFDHVFDIIYEKINNSRYDVEEENIELG